MIPLLIAVAALEVWAWRRHARLVRDGHLSRWDALARLSGWAAVPSLCALGLFGVGVGLEELWHEPILPERVILLVLPVVAISLAVVTTFSVWIAVGPRPVHRGAQSLKSDLSESESASDETGDPPRAQFPTRSHRQ